MAGVDTVAVVVGITVVADIMADMAVASMVTTDGADGTDRDFILASASIPPLVTDTDTELGPTIPFGTKGPRRFTQNRRS
jgi:hypothetical protein